jgi:hypothetical protein
MKADDTGQNREDQIVSFQGWKEALAAETFAAEQKAAFRQEVVYFLHHCKVHHAGASIMLAKQYLAVAETQGRTGAREALRWWFRAARRFQGAAAQPGTVFATEGTEAEKKGSVKGEE